MASDDVKIIMKAGVSILIDAVLDLLQADPHQWSMRPCPTCKTITGLIGKPFGCYEFQRKNANGN